MMTKQQEKFIELYSFKKKNYTEIENELNINREEIINLRDEKVNKLIDNIQNIYSKFNDKRKESFNDNFRDFYNWYENQGQKCGYCGISQKDLYKLFSKENRILPYLDSDKEYKKTPKRSSGTLEIERLDSASKYDSENMILACPLCNNAKSNLIDEENWRKLFVPAMKQYYKDILT
jgi:5-methylcytosine-specific restriction endonuclease McrA